LRIDLVVELVVLMNCTGFGMKPRETQWEKPVGPEEQWLYICIQCGIKVYDLDM